MLGLLAKYSPQVLEDNNLPTQDDKTEVKASYMLHCLSYGASHVEKGSLSRELINIVGVLDKASKHKFVKELVRSPNTYELQMLLAMQSHSQAKVILRYSKQISDLDIIKILEHHSAARTKLMHIVANRRNVKETLLDYLIFRGDIECLGILLQNDHMNIVGEYLCEVLIRVRTNEELALKALARLHQNDRDMKNLVNKLEQDQIEPMLKLYLDLNPHVIVYLPNKPSFNGIKFFVSQTHAKKLQHDVEALHKVNHLSANVIVKYLANGDLYSFCFALSKACDISFQKITELVSANPLSATLQNTYTAARISEDLINAINEILEVLYLSGLEQFLTSRNFPNIIRDKFELILGSKPDSSAASVKYLISLIDQ